ncbi:hypothetical protein, partial [Pseudomonas syringae group genomosp. 7]
AAQPAQAVDLGQFRAVVNYWIEDCKTKPLGEERAGFIAYGERLLALIDSQAVGQEPLWCLHVLGMDDVHPAPSKAHAEKAAAWHNEQFKDQA